MAVQRLHNPFFRIFASKSKPARAMTNQKLASARAGANTDARPKPIPHQNRECNNTRPETVGRFTITAANEMTIHDHSSKERGVSQSQQQQRQRSTRTVGTKAMIHNHGSNRGCDSQPKQQQRRQFTITVATKAAIHDQQQQK